MTTILPFTFGNYEFTDLRDESPAVHVRVAELRQFDLGQRFPRLLLCDCPESRERDRLMGADSEALVPIRDSRENYRGELRPLSFVIRRQGEFFGAWQWFALRVLADDERVLRVFGGYWPTYDSTYKDRRTVRLALRHMFPFLNRRLPMSDGRDFVVQRAVVPTLLGEPIVTELYAELALLPEYDVVRVDESAKQPGRERARITRSAEPPRRILNDPMEPRGG